MLNLGCCRVKCKKRHTCRKVKELLGELALEQDLARRTGRYPAVSCPVCLEQFTEADEEAWGIEAPLQSRGADLAGAVVASAAAESSPSEPGTPSATPSAPDDSSEGKGGSRQPLLHTHRW